MPAQRLGCVVHTFLELTVNDCNRLAELLPARRPRARLGNFRRQHPLHAARGGRRRPLRRAPRPRLPRRPEAHGQTVRRCTPDCCCLTSSSVSQACLCLVLYSSIPPAVSCSSELRVCNGVVSGLVLQLLPSCERCLPHEDARGLTCANHACRYCMNAAALKFIPEGEALPAESKPVQ